MERADLEQWRPRDVARLLALVEGQRRYFQDIVAVLPVGILVLSADLQIVLANAVVRKILNLPEHGPLRVRLDAVLPSWVLDRVAQVIETRSAETNVSVETTSGQRLQIGIVAIPGWDEEGGREALVTIQGLQVPVQAPPSSPVPVRRAAVPAQTASAVAENVAAVLWAIEPGSMRPVFVSSQAERLLGFAAHFWIDNQSFWADRVHLGDRERVMQFYQEAVKSREESSCEFRSVRADGEAIWLRETVRTVTDAAGNPIYLAGITVDITERRRLEAQLVQRERIEAMQKLASRMAHDLNNMLMILEGNAEEVLDGLPAASNLRGEVEAIIAAAHRMTGLTGHLLAFSRNTTAVTEAIDLEEVLRGVAQRLGVRRRGALSRSRVNANAAQLAQVLETMIAAAAPKSGGEVILEASNIEIREELQRPNAPLEPGEYVSIVIGASEAKAELRAGMFERFLPEKDAADQVGMKLAEVYAMVRRWRGDIVVAGEQEEGTVFRVFLERAGEAPKLGDLAVAPGEPGTERRAATILMVEDEAGIRALVQKFLRRHGYDVLEAPNGEQAMELVAKHGGLIDLLITDMIMPRMGGRELAERLRAQARELKILYISGYTDDSTVYAAELPPGNAFLQKPFTLSALLEKVRALLAS